MIITATVIDLTKKRRWINHKRRQSGWRDASPNHPLIHPTLATPDEPTKQSRKPLENARIPPQARPQPPPPSNQSAYGATRTQNIRRGSKATAATTQGGGGIQRTAGTPPGRPEFRRREDARRPAGRRGIGHQCGGDVREARKGVDGSEKDTYRAGRVVPAATGGVQPLCRAGARRQGRRGGEEKKLVGEVGEGYKEGGSHLPPLFLSLAPSISLLPLCDDKARRLDSYPSLALPPPPLLCSGWWFLSLLLLPLIPWRFPSIHCVSLSVFFLFCEGHR